MERKRRINCCEKETQRNEAWSGGEKMKRERVRDRVRERERERERERDRDNTQYTRKVKRQKVQFGYGFLNHFPRKPEQKRTLIQHDWPNDSPTISKHQSRNY